MVHSDDDDDDDNDNDEYVNETASSADETSPNDDEIEGRTFFSSRTYSSREYIKASVVAYNQKHGRAFSITSSDHRRYKAVCVDLQCAFVVSFAYGKSFGPPTVIIPHSCDPTRVDLQGYEARRAEKASFLVEMGVVRQFVIDNGRKASPAELRDVLAHGHLINYQTCVDVCNRLKTELFEEDREQYQLILSYIQEMNSKGHKAHLDLRDDTISRVVVVFKQGIQVLSVYADRGLNLDGTFMKHQFGGILLVACLRNTNNELQIVAVAWVSGETKDNWSWFVKFLLSATNKRPAFIVSDRDKGLVPAMQEEAPALPHFFCVRHMLENFNAKFRNETLKNMAWNRSKSLTTTSFLKRSGELQLKTPKALAWLMDVDKAKWSAAHSPCARFGTTTSNNVESVNNVLLGARAKPLLDCLMEVERYVGAKWVEFVGKSSSWNSLTAYAQKKFVRDRLVATADKITVNASCSSSFVIKVRKDGELPVEYAVDLDNRVSACSCGYFEYMKAPCTHVIAALRSINRLADIEMFFYASWMTATYRRAYDPALKTRPYVIKSDLLRFAQHAPPAVPKKRGRPRKSTKRIESQPASLAIKAKTKYKYTPCNVVSHNKRSYQKK